MSLTQKNNNNNNEKSDNISSIFALYLDKQNTQSDETENYS